jgi:transposase InsO family protein
VRPRRDSRLEEVRRGAVRALRGPRGDPGRGGHADHQVLLADRLARADLAPASGSRSPGQATQTATAAAGPRADPRRRPPGCAGASGVGSPHGVATGANCAATTACRCRRPACCGCLPPVDQATSAAWSTGANQVWQLDSTEFATNSGGTRRLAGCRDHWSKYELGWHVSPTANQHDASATIEFALTEAARLAGRPLIDLASCDDEGNVIPLATVVTDNGGPFRSFRLEAFTPATRATPRFSIDAKESYLLDTIDIPPAANENARTNAFLTSGSRSSRSNDSNRAGSRSISATPPTSPLSTAEKRTRHL